MRPLIAIFPLLCVIKDIGNQVRRIVADVTKMLIISRDGAAGSAEKIAEGVLKITADCLLPSALKTPS